MTHESLTAQASVVYDWKSDVLKTRPPPKLPFPGSRAFSSIASLTAPQDSDDLSESDAHGDDPPNEHFSPTIQPPTPPPRLAGPVAINTTRPRSATLPPSTRPVGLEVAPMPPKPGTPVKTAPASLPSNPISDDWIEDDLAGGSTIVRPSIVHGVTADVALQQDPTSSGATDTVDEDGFYSPAFVSIYPRVYPHSVANSKISEFSRNDTV